MEGYKSNLQLEGGLICPVNMTSGYLTAYNAIYTYELDQKEEIAHTEKIFNGNFFELFFC